MLGAGIRIAVVEGLPTTVLWSILGLNLMGALLLGALYEHLAAERRRGSATWALLGPGLLGALTTFSAMQLEAVELVRSGSWTGGVLYLVASVALGVPAAALGRRLGRVGA